MFRKTPNYLLKGVAISLGFTFAFALLEIFARFLPASDIFSQKLPLRCKSPLASFSEVDQDCLFQANAKYQGIYTKGKFPPFPIKTFKRANDIGQYTDVDFREVVGNRSNIIPIVSIGDSYVQALQVRNAETYHGRLNNYVSENKKIIKSTAIGTAGNPLSQYLISKMFAHNHITNPESIYIFSIISNDFDESILGKSKVQYGGRFKLKPDYGLDEIVFINRYSSIKVKIRKLILKYSALSRYLASNLNISTLAYTYPFCMLADFPCEQIKNFNANIIDSGESGDTSRFEYSYKASDIFLSEVEKIRNTPLTRRNTIFVVDADRSSIYSKNMLESEYFKKQRNYFIKKAMDYGFTVIDMKSVFAEHYKINNQRFEFSNDGHWNSLGHKIITDEIAKNLNLKMKSKK
ncbi:hypothetical protein [Prochlorococcus marinus]|uniref:hypothetical protein n=1 Tax=Prochlorococcus marinus TaxID=1219 RepID=UPI001ADAB32B|nr:hypothetical protein [Prochlorococcus marinus]MBO8218004.1 hypothetical protein [Prochlorococcus marinus XMU1405]MBW3039340.1 hypothetical protein [Prochlorococcus marinus str. MU1405]MBW3046796.1 hypothetical protein [Prochlorococcus marinus str. MU1406]